MHSIFFELTLVLILAGTLAYVMNFLRQPSIVAYIAAGLIIGPLGAVQIKQAAVFHDLSQIGITLLLFMVGLEMDFGQVKKLGKTTLIAPRFS
jgi:Kef-type K+ transport system membrane component KefB